MQGWDHHCVALNNCVGVRNFRSFVTFLCVSTLFAIFVTVTNLIILFGNREYAPSTVQLRIGTGVGLLLAAITFLLTVKPLMKNKVRFTVALVGMICAVISTLCYCRHAAQFIAGSYLYFAIGYTLIIRQMLFQYLDLVSKHMTTKEMKARQ